MDIHFRIFEPTAAVTFSHRRRRSGFKGAAATGSARRGYLKSAQQWVGRAGVNARRTGGAVIRAVARLSASRGEKVTESTEAKEKKCWGFYSLSVVGVAVHVVVLHVEVLAEVYVAGAALHAVLVPVPPVHAQVEAVQDGTPAASAQVRRGRGDGVGDVGDGGGGGGGADGGQRGRRWARRGLLLLLSVELLLLLLLLLVLLLLLQVEVFGVADAVAVGGVLQYRSCCRRW